MRTAKEILKESYKTTDVFDYPYETNVVLNAIKQAQLEAIDETVKACIEAAKILSGKHPDSKYDPRPVFTYEVDKQSILSVGEQLKLKL